MNNYIKKQVIPYEKSVFLLLNKIDEKKHEYNLDQDGVELIDDTIYVKTIEENFENPIYVSIELIYCKKNKTKCTKNLNLINVSRWNDMKNRKIFTGGDILSLQPEKKENGIVILDDKIEVFVYVNNYYKPTEVCFMIQAIK